ncbi:uncharacterized protein LOC121236457 [Juglans microcarpa x Juglans regia]|uniref:uncharacterized protein LOC121236457 n=1 Tax=Juglans microcarpa x Juglans regia TaxID=2249226 RepID=UPI001B7E927B|nr:uncharacterized protein LOC121236457 [Juglans microcarpa x Juglans regia]
MESTRATESETIKFLCSYGGKILPRSTDGNLRYVGGLTRVLSVHRSISHAELMVKVGEFCGYSVTLRCQLPSGDLETLVSITSDEDLANIIEEYDRASSSMSHPPKIRAILSPPKSLKKISPPPSTTPSDADSYAYGSPFVSAGLLKNSVAYHPVPRTRNCSENAYRYNCHIQENPRVLFPYSWGVPSCNHLRRGPKI